jgi:hypothetical protein
MKFKFLLLLSFITGSILAQSSDSPYDKEYETKEGLRRVVYKNKYGYIDEKRKEVIPLEYAEAEDFYEGLAKVSLDRSKYGYINERGAVVVPLQYEEFMYRFQGGYSPARKDGKWGMINDKGKTIVPHKYEAIYYYYDGFAVAKKSEGTMATYGFVDMKGKEAISFKYEDAGNFSDGLAPVKDGGRYGFIDTRGKTAIPFSYDQAYGFYEGLSAVKVKGKWGFIDKKNNMVIAPIYDNVYPFKAGEAEVAIGDEGFRIDKNGKRLKPGKWLMVLTKGLKMGDQFWYRNEKYTDVIYEKFKEGFRYSDVAWNLHEKELFIVMTKTTTYWQTGLQYNNSYDQVWKKIVDFYKDGKSITTLAYNGKWSVIAADLGGGFGEVAYSNTNFPIDNVKKAWQEGKFITTMAYGDRWIVVMRKAYFSDQFIKEYDSDAWNSKDVEDQMKKGYAVTEVVKYRSTFYVVFTKGSGIKEQLFIWNDELPIRDIKGYWDKGYKSYKTFYIPRSILINKGWDDLF